VSVLGEELGDGDLALLLRHRFRGGAPRGGGLRRGRCGRWRWDGRGRSGGLSLRGRGLEQRHLDLAFARYGRGFSLGLCQITCSPIASRSLARDPRASVPPLIRRSWA
jgi:hypothetical protein